MTKKDPDGYDLQLFAERSTHDTLEDIAASLRLIARALCALAGTLHFQRDDEHRNAPGGRQ